MILATYTLCNVAAIAIEDIAYGIDDKIKARLIVSDSVKPKKAHWYKIRYEFSSDAEDAEARAYFNFGRHKIYLDECMRTNFI